MNRWIPAVLAAGLIVASLGYLYIPQAANHGQFEVVNANPDPNPQRNPGHQ